MKISSTLLSLKMGTKQPKNKAQSSTRKMTEDKPAYAYIYICTYNTHRLDMPADHNTWLLFHTPFPLFFFSFLVCCCYCYCRRHYCSIEGLFIVKLSLISSCMSFVERAPRRWLYLWTTYTTSQAIILEIYYRYCYMIMTYMYITEHLHAILLRSILSETYKMYARNIHEKKK